MRPSKTATRSPSFRPSPVVDRRLPRKLWGRLVAGLRRLPVIARGESCLYREIEAGLLLSPPIPAPRGIGRWLPLPPAPVVREVVAAAGPGRLIDPADLRPDDEALLARHGIALRHVLANRTTRAGRFDGRLAAPDQTEAGTHFQDRAFIDRVLTATCPSSGRSLSATRSLMAEANAPIFYRFYGERVFDLAVGREGQGYIPLYLHLPALRLVILLVDRYRWHGWDEIDQLRALLIAEHRRVRAYLNRTDPPEVCALIDNRHFAHHLWNVLSGLERLIDNGVAQGVDRLLVAAEPIGPLEALFPELDPAAGAPPIKRAEFPALIGQALANNRLLLRPGGRVISDRLIRRVLDLAETQASAEARASVRRLRDQTGPVLWVTLRTENRTWVSQVPGITAIGGWLARDFPGAALILDGFSVPRGVPKPMPAEQARSIAREQVLADAIARALAPHMPVCSLIGAPLLDCLLHTQVADAYLAHHGSVQHKIGWFADCPGVIHANRLVLTDPVFREPALIVRPDAPTPIWLDAQRVRDIPGAPRPATNRWIDDLDNYDFDPALAYGEIKRLLESRRRPVHDQRFSGDSM